MIYTDSLLWLYHGHLESREVEDSRDFEYDSELEQVWDEYREQAEHALRLIMSETAFEALDANELHWDSDIIHTLDGSGIGVWDGRWDEYAPNQAGRLSASIKGDISQGVGKPMINLSDWADGSGGGKLSDAFEACYFRNLSAPTMVTTAFCDETGADVSTSHFEGDASIALAINENSDTPAEAPLGWVNSASIHADASQDRIIVCVSTGDPRGAFSMELRRTPDGKILIHLPHPGEGLAHETTRELHPGTLILTRTE